MKIINAGLIGCGTIGKGVSDIFLKNRRVLKNRSNIDIRLHSVCDIDRKILRNIKGSFIKTNNYEKITGNPDIHIVIELVGGTGIARTICEKSISTGKNIVTANKALLAKYWKELFSAAAKSSTDIYFEASVGGGIPVIKSLREGLIANRITEIIGILNGTCNYILTRMDEDSLEFNECLKIAQKLGYAEADPTFDIEGNDTAHKIYILSQLAYNISAKFRDVYTEGITKITSMDLQMANELGYKIKLLAFAEKVKAQVNLRVHPTMIKSSSVLANVSGVENAVSIKGDFIDHVLLTGPGAGQRPTASAVISDVVDVAKNIADGKTGGLSKLIISNLKKADCSVTEPEDFHSKFYLRCTTIDKPGVLAKITGILGKHDISIEACVQKGEHKATEVPIILLTHPCIEGNLKHALREIDRLPYIKKKSFFLRVNDTI